MCCYLILKIFHSLWATMQLKIEKTSICTTAAAPFSSQSRKVVIYPISARNTITVLATMHMVERFVSIDFYISNIYHNLSNPDGFSEKNHMFQVLNKLNFIEVFHECELFSVNLNKISRSLSCLQLTVFITVLQILPFLYHLRNLVGHKSMRKQTNWHRKGWRLISQVQSQSVGLDGQRPKNLCKTWSKENFFF